MECKKISAMIVASDGVIESSVEQHCAACPACREQLSAWNKLRDIVPGGRKEAPLNADFAIIQAARKRADRRRHTVFVHRVICYTAMAAAVAVACFVGFNEYRDVRRGYLAAQWDWKTFEQASFELNAEVVASKVYMTYGNEKKEKIDKLSELEEEIKNI